MHAPPEPNRVGPTAPSPAGAPDSAHRGASSLDPAGSGRSLALARLVLAALVVVAAAALYGWFELRRDAQAFRTEVAERLTTADAAIGQARVRESELANALRDAQAKVALLEARLAESQSQQAALETLYRELAPSRDELALTEVEQILALASQQLTLAGNVQAALAAVQLADAKLARMERPQLVPLRRALARDMDALKAVPYVDVAGISLKLDQALGMVDELPLARDERLPATQPARNPQEESAWLRFARDAWADLRSVVRIEVSDRPAAPLVAPQENFFLRENLRLRLLAARLALLSRDERSFRTDLTAARTWLERYFDTRVKPVQAAASTLAQLSNTSMAAEIPDLSRSLDAVRLLRASSERVERAPPAPRPR
jgi:uroporphyrin-III C-methyltransferase